jgi:hypothetical protein
MYKNGSITAVREPVEDGVLKAHLKGRYRVGSYMVGKDNRTPFLVFDIDKPKRSFVRKITRRLNKRGITPYVERSKSKGFHIWVFFAERIRARIARKLAYSILGDLDQSKIEVLPKQDTVKEGGLGNCIWLPLCKSDISRKRTVFLGENFEPIEKQWALLKSTNKVSKAKLLECIREHAPEVGGGSQATRLADLAASAKLRHTPDNEAYATIQVSDHAETVCLKDPAFKRWLARLHYSKFGKVPPTHALSDAIAVLNTAYAPPVSLRIDGVSWVLRF